LLARSVKGLEKVYDEIVAAGGKEPAAIPLDLLTATDEQLSNAAFQIKQTLGRLDGIVHCASHFYALSPCPTRALTSG
jgi:short-subunit dehydrogenase